MLELREEEGVSIGYFQNTRILDEATVQALGSELLELAARSKTGKLLLNFRNVLLMSSAMIGKLILLRNRCQDADVELAFCEISPNVSEVFTLMKLDKLVDLYADESSALDALREI